MLTHIDKTHHHVGIIQKAAVLLAHHRWSRGRVNRFIREHTVLVSVLQDGVVQIQHVHGSCGVSLVEERPGAMRQAEDGEDLPLHLSALLTLEPPLDETRLNVIIQSKVCAHCICDHTPNTCQHKSTKQLKLSHFE